nr:NADH dehydrogenase subunit 6 [Chlamydomonas sp. UWO 241]AXQ87821.1 NADH dehydrogenase subunit 6 [Chlamydomonas sp. UWO 241]
MSLFLMSCICHCALLAISVSWTRSPFMALMFAVMLFINASICLLMLGFEFLALVNILVYVGALAVLFLFVIMLLEIPSTELRAYNRGWSALALFGFLGITKTLFSSSFSWSEATTGDIGEAGFLWTGISTEESFQKNQLAESLAGQWTSSIGLDLYGHGAFGSIAGLVPTLESLTYVGHAFYVTYADLLILNSLILTIALFGALVLAHTSN